MISDGLAISERPVRERTTGVPQSSSAPTLIQATLSLNDDGSLVELIESLDDRSKAEFAVFQNSVVRYAHELKIRDRIFVPPPREQDVLKHIRLASGARPYESVGALLRQINDLFSRCIDLGNSYRFLLAAFVLTTWLIDWLPVAPYIALVGLPHSGKSTVLSLLRLLCRRALLTADLTSAAFYQACNEYGPTLLIDETLTAGDKRALFHLLRLGTRPDVVALRKNQSFNAFGAKVVSWTELPDDEALNSRCIVIPMQETDRTDLERPTDPKVRAAADDLIMQLLQYRFEHQKSFVVAEFAGDDCLKSRTRDLYQALSFAVGDDVNAREWLLRLFRDQQESNREPLSPEQAAVVRTVYSAMHPQVFTTKFETIGMMDIATKVNDDLKKRREGFRLSPRRVGAILTALGISNRKRTRFGWEVQFDRQTRIHIHRLLYRVGLENSCGEVPSCYQEACDICQDKHESVMANLSAIRHRLLTSGCDSQDIGEHVQVTMKPA